MLCQPSSCRWGGSPGEEGEKERSMMLWEMPPLVVYREETEWARRKNGRMVWGAEGPAYIQWAGQTESQLADSAVETAADFRENNRAARLLADDACMAHTRCPAGLLFRSHTTETAESLTIMTSSTVQCSHSSWTTSLSSLHGSFPLSCLKNKQRWQSHRWRSMLERAITQHASLTYTPLRLARFRN